MVWGETLESFEVVHDHSEAVRRSESQLLRLADPSAPPATFSLGETELTYPLRMTSLRRVDSRDWPEVQLADVLAGGCVLQQSAGLVPPRDAGFVEALRGVGVRELFVQFLAPAEFVRKTMEVEGGPTDVH